MQTDPSKLLRQQAKVMEQTKNPEFYCGNSSSFEAIEAVTEPLSCIKPQTRPKVTSVVSSVLWSTEPVLCRLREWSAVRGEWLTSGVSPERWYISSFLRRSMKYSILQIAVMPRTTSDIVVRCVAPRLLEESNISLELSLSLSLSRFEYRSKISTNTIKI